MAADDDGRRLGRTAIQAGPLPEVFSAACDATEKSFAQPTQEATIVGIASAGGLPTVTEALPGRGSRREAQPAEADRAGGLLERRTEALLEADFNVPSAW